MFARAAKMMVTQSSVGAMIGKIPRVPELFRNRVWRSPHFMNSFFGVYRSYAEASAAAFKDRTLGWDNNAVTAAELNQPSIFASMFWIAQLIKPGSTLVDFGGATGSTFLHYSARLDFPAGARWIVVELPAVVRRVLAAYGDDVPPQLAFETDINALTDYDIFFSAGCIQYLDMTPRQIAGMIAPSARHVILNKFALTEGPSFWTLQHLGDAMAPNQIYNEKEFVSAFEDAGFVLRDRWDVAELNCQIPFEPKRYVSSYAGVYFERRQS